jgi:hypothetical protein
MFNWLVSLLWERRLRKQQAGNDKIFTELGKNEVIIDMAKKDPEFRENLRVLGIKSPPSNTQ